ncbi:restriction endonuclease [Streptosporangium sp. NPDC048865]|uniref:restriction endonuclease n=1 Tax=Streptosporangium sp. NPDC048865 TaxID=3155766 RepID=UPI003444E6B1
MARRRTPAKAARRRASGGRRPRRRTGDGDGFLWAVAAVALVAIAVWLVDLVVAHWPLVIGGTIALVAGLAGALLLRRRVIEAREREWLRDNARLELVDRMTGDGFEALVEALLRREGFHGVRRIGGSGDGGVDVVATAPGGDRFVVQCKRWGTSVGAPQIRDLLGALHAYPGHRGVLVTSATFTAPAREYAAGTGLTLIDRALLAAWFAGSFTLAPRARRGAGRRFPPGRRPATPCPDGEAGLEGALGDEPA